MTIRRRLDNPLKAGTRPVKLTETLLSNARSATSSTVKKYGVRYPVRQSLNIFVSVAECPDNATRVTDEPSRVAVPGTLPIDPTRKSVGIGSCHHAPAKSSRMTGGV